MRTSDSRPIAIDRATDGDHVRFMERAGSAARALAEPASAGVRRETRSRMETLRCIAPNVHDAILDTLADALLPPPATPPARAVCYLAAAVSEASGGRGWLALHSEMCERRSREDLRQGVG